jgi:hypothetical protein
VTRDLPPDGLGRDAPPSQEAQTGGQDRDSPPGGRGHGAELGGRSRDSARGGRGRDGESGENRAPEPAGQSSGGGGDSESVAGLRGEVSELRDQIAAILRDQIAGILRELQERPDRLMIERLFEKFKASLSNLADTIKKSQGDDKNYATMEDLKRLEQMFRATTVEFEEAAAARKSTRCLSCGRGYRQVTGAIPDETTLAVLGAAPISHLTNDQKPCFVYGSDHELYYAASPRGKTFVAPPPARNRAKQ